MLVACHQYVCQGGIVYPIALLALLQESMFCLARPHRQEDGSCQEAKNVGTAFDSYRIVAIALTLLCVLFNWPNQSSPHYAAIAFAAYAG